jgi:hypothetical protein
MMGIKDIDNVKEDKPHDVIMTKKNALGSPNQVYVVMCKTCSQWWQFALCPEVFETEPELELRLYNKIKDAHLFKEAKNARVTGAEWKEARAQDNDQRSQGLRRGRPLY